MKIHFSKENLSPKEHQLQRALEILPGLTSWSILIGMIALSFSKPLWAAILVIAFDLYWLFKLAYMTIFLLLSYFRLTTEEDTDWNEKIRHIDDMHDHLKSSPQPPSMLNLGKYFSWKRHYTELSLLKESGTLPPRSKDIYNAVIFPVAKESIDVIEPGIERLSAQSFPVKRILVIFAVEERAPQQVKEGILTLQKKYRTQFLDFLVVFHPDDLPGEEIGRAHV